MDALAKLGIDGWGLLLYFVNFGILFLVLKKLAYKPIMEMIDERKKRIKDDVEGASALRASLEEKAATEEEERKARLLDLDERIKQAKGTAREEAKRMLSQAEEQRDAVLSSATKAADERIASIINEAEQDILIRVKRVVAHVLEEGVPQEFVEESVKKSFDVMNKAS